MFCILTLVEYIFLVGLAEDLFHQIFDCSPG